MGAGTASGTSIVLEFKVVVDVVEVVGSMTLTNTPLEHWVEHPPPPPTPIADNAAEIVIGWTNSSLLSP